VLISLHRRHVRYFECNVSFCCSVHLMSRHYWQALTQCKVTLHVPTFSERTPPSYFLPRRSVYTVGTTLTAYLKKRVYYNRGILHQSKGNSLSYALSPFTSYINKLCLQNLQKWLSLNYTYLINSYLMYIRVCVCVCVCVCVYAT
jgi:hypothetical protein